jgi:5-methylthioadenosine/S-adenosylhomocysteine deaminase
MGKDINMHEADLIISGAKALLLDAHNTCLDRASVAIKADEIIAVGPTKDIAKQYQAKKTIRLDNALIMPGFVNGHTHAAMTCFRGIADDLDLMVWLNNYIFPAEAKNVNKTLSYWGSLLGIAEMIKSGTTTFCDMYIFEDETARAAKEAGMRCLIGEVLFDFPSPNLKTPDEGIAYTQMLIEKWRSDPLVNIMIQPHALYTCSKPLLEEVKNLARAKRLAEDYHLPIGLHLLENAAEKKQLEEKLGKSAVSFLKDIGYLDDQLIAFHCVEFSENDIRLFVEHHCKVVHNPASNMKLASGVAPVPDMIKAGIPVGLGTDGCASNNNLDMIKEMGTAARLHKVARLDPTVMDAQSVVRMATLEGAKVLGMEKQIGSLEPGKKADVIILDLNKPHLTPLYNAYSHLVYAASGADVDTVVINGQVVMENRRLMTIDEEEVMRKVREISLNVKQSLHL